MEADLVAAEGDRRIGRGRVDGVVTQHDPLSEAFGIREDPARDHIGIARRGKDADVAHVTFRVPCRRQTVWARGTSVLAFHLFIDTLDAVYLGVDVHIERRVLVVPVEVLLVASKDAKVVVDLVVRRAVIVVQAAPVSGVIRHDEVVVDVVQCRCAARRAGRDVGHIGQPVPGVERAVIARFATCVEEQVAEDLGPPTKPVVEVDGCPRNVVNDVVRYDRLSTQRLKVERALLLNVPDLVA
mmetsp:Transcript_35156/g.79773  ORF Transcript_35156/g.79773 Transcript_35156/m.79773 type:complete len:241 (-) Transcript_35156:91-813(-)